MRVALDLENRTEQYLLSALNQLSLKDIIRSQGLRDAFGEIITRGTVEELWYLVPQTQRAGLLKLGSDRSISVQSSQPPSEPSSSASASEPSTSTSKPSEPPSSSTSKPSSTSEQSSTSRPSAPLSFILNQTEPHSLASKLPLAIPSDIQTRVNRLFKTIRGFRTPLSQETYGKLWTHKEGIFRHPANGISEQVLNLQQGRRRIKAGIFEYDCASRFALLFLAHYVDHIASCPLERMQNGQSRRSHAFEVFSSMSNTPVKEVKYDYKCTRLYKDLIAVEGLGILLEIGPNLSAMWERKLTKQDLADILYYREFRRREQQRCAGSQSRDVAKEQQQRAASLNKVAADIIIDGLRANGWSRSDLLSSKTPLMTMVAKCLSGKIDKETPSKKRKREGSRLVFSSGLRIDAQQGRGSEDAQKLALNDAQPTLSLDIPTTQEPDSPCNSLQFSATVAEQHLHNLDCSTGAPSTPNGSTYVNGDDLGSDSEIADDYQDVQDSGGNTAQYRLMDWPTNGWNGNLPASQGLQIHTRTVISPRNGYLQDLDSHLRGTSFLNAESAGSFVSRVSNPNVEGMNFMPISQNESSAVQLPNNGNYSLASRRLHNVANRYPQNDEELLVTQACNIAVDAIPPNQSQIWNHSVDEWNNAVDAIPPNQSQIWNHSVDEWNNAVDAIPPNQSQIWNNSVDEWNNAVDAIPPNRSQIWDNSVDEWNNAVDAIPPNQIQAWNNNFPLNSIPFINPSTAV